jgi:poly-gamma-glutamate capsule biosynthesis protein CapA/YwtB (metallophosphatase superfamily)
MNKKSSSRRDFLGAISAATGTAMAGCSSLADVFPASDPPDSGSQSSGSAVRGRVVNTAGTPIVDAEVVALGVDGTELSEGRTNSEGRFSLGVRRPVWIRIRAEKYRPRVRACSPGPTNRVVVVRSKGSATLAFGGDTMFARRFYTEPSDHLNPRMQIDPGTRRADHDAILAPLSPALRVPDLTSVNLETPLTTRSLRHPEKLYTFASHPVAVESLATAGIDYTALGNNHAFDALGPGLQDTTEALDEAGIGYSGAGASPEAAWEPHFQQAGDLEVALLSCTTITGDQYTINWTANGPTERPVTTTIDGRERTVPPDIGVARATTDRLSESIHHAKEVADVVVVQIHGGEPYQRTQTAAVQQLTATAAQNGADLVVNHHPHVTGGIEQLSGTVVAWSLGNLIFDQKIWPTFQSYLLSATVTADDVVRVTADPILLDGFVPYGVVGKPNRTVTWRTLETSADMATPTRSGVALGAGTQATTVTEESFSESGAIYSRQFGWITDVTDGQVRLGHDRLPTGTFESINVDNRGYDGILWRYGRTFPTVANGYGINETGGVRLRRVSGNRSPAILSNTRRIPISGPVTVGTQYRTQNEGTTIEVTWFTDTNGPAISRNTWSLSPTQGIWRRFLQDVTPPSDATHANILFRLQPPTTGGRQTDIDDVRFIEWGDQPEFTGRGFDHLYVQEPATVKFESPGFADRVVWSRIN